MKRLAVVLICSVCIVPQTESKGKHSSSSESGSVSTGLAKRVSELEDRLDALQSCCLPVFGHMETPDLYEYRVIRDDILTIPGDETTFKFQVRACNDAHILLMQINSTIANIHEIVIGGWSNSRSVIRDAQQGAPLATTNHVDGPLNCDEFHAFWVNWDEGIIRVGSGLIVDVNEFISFTDPTPMQVRHVAISTGWGATGKWLLYDRKAITWTEEPLHIY